MTGADPVALPEPFRWDGEHIAVTLSARAHALFTTRRGGASVGPLASFDLGFVDARHDRDQARVHYRQLAAAVGVTEIVRAVQVHGADVAVIDTPPAEPVAETDALVTTAPTLGLSVVTADCLPIALGNHQGVAVIHAGWRGLAAGIVAATAARLAAVTETPVTAAAIGPGIGRCCFSVGDEVRAAFAAYPETHHERTVDLAAIAARQLAEAGIARVDDVGLCTVCSPAELFYSHRRDAGDTGRQAGLVWLS